MLTAGAPAAVTSIRVGSHRFRYRTTTITTRFVLCRTKFFASQFGRTCRRLPLGQSLPLESRTPAAEVAVGSMAAAPATRLDRARQQTANACAKVAARTRSSGRWTTGKRWKKSAGKPGFANIKGLAQGLTICALRKFACPPLFTLNPGRSAVASSAVLASSPRSFPLA
jgi:hypothetical protein